MEARIICLGTKGRELISVFQLLAPDQQEALLTLLRSLTSKGKYDSLRMGGLAISNPQSTIELPEMPAPAGPNPRSEDFTISFLELGGK
jgi:hypothetical protein